MERRGIIIHPEDISPLWPQRLQEAGLNVLGLHPVGGSSAPASLRCALMERNRPDMRRFLQALEKRNIAVEYEMHALGYLLPPELLDTHPDFSRWMTGACAGPGRICVPHIPTRSIISPNKAIV